MTPMHGIMGVFFFLPEYCDIFLKFWPLKFLYPLVHAINLLNSYCQMIRYLDIFISKEFNRCI